MHPYMLAAIKSRKAEKYAWPGGYPIGYVCDDGGLLCGDCVNDATNPVHTADVDDMADGWRIDGFIVIEGSEEDYDSTLCDHCGLNLLTGEMRH